ncbi:MAG: diaminopimelate decarboxylase, partial [Alphaproteobacteria bacterium]|nr:diaminopimelate decarboxylase [Alphaproteobacteria bacterium]
IILQKQSGGKDIVVVDAAMNDLIRPTLYQAYHGLLPVARKLLKNNNNNNIDKITTDVVGGICESGDYLALQRPLPKLQNGDILAICQAGAYATVMASNYNHRMLPAEVMVDGKHHRIIKLRQDFDDFLKTEKLKNKK